jgi:hypothetical protein
MKTKWADLNIKDKLAILSAVIAFVLGWCMSIAGFWIPPIGEVADSILWILGQALLYAASVFGVSAYFRSETVQLKRDMDRHLEHIERMQIRNFYPHSAAATFLTHSFYLKSVCFPIPHSSCEP